MPLEGFLGLIVLNFQNARRPCQAWIWSNVTDMLAEKPSICQPQGPWPLEVATLGGWRFIAAALICCHGVKVFLELPFGSLVKSLSPVLYSLMVAYLCPWRWIIFLFTFLSAKRPVEPSHGFVWLYVFQDMEYCWLIFQVISLPYYML